MTSLVVGLLQGPVAWLLVSAGISLFLQAYAGFAAPATIGISLLAGAAAWASAGLLLSAVHRWRERSAITSGIAGVAPRDGASSVVVGTVEATGPVLRTPLDGSPCVAYNYRIDHVTGTGKQRFMAGVARGSALTPCVVVTRTGSYRLLAVPELEASTPAGSQSDMIASFQRYATTATFMSQKEGADELLAQWSDADGQYRADVGYPKLHDEDTMHWVLHQQHLPPGSLVCVFGRFSQAQSGIVQPAGGGPVRVVRGNVEQVAAGLRSKAVFRSVLGLLFGGASAGLLWLFVNA